MIKIKHNINRDGCTLSGQILDCQFSDGEERGDNVYHYDEEGKLLLTSCHEPGLQEDFFFIWGHKEEKDLQEISYTYYTEQEAQNMLDFINTFTDKEEPAKENVEDKPEPIRYALVRVGGDTGEGYCCHLSPEEENVEESDGLCSRCPHGKTLSEIAEEVKKLQEAQNVKSI